MRIMELAAQVSGGVSPLAEKLGSPVADVVERWIAGKPPPPTTRIFILALDIVAG
jgi:hypothetical protein